ncbi:MAG: hypothetical protein BAA01_04905 [Bacillus thermozeamaize]|uniref:Regulatory protein YycH domain-containing protein n=1 Tax=Bacillus thermozeamaize TaxID=230954 RepID=A0A1Y3PJT5_9BACI|nr:MAG: hypothetical protein BAA01_04905 [Bacillus thermozeamaize]
MNELQRRMIETGKSILLVFLVLLSIFLTWLLWYQRPPFTAVEKNYTSIPPLGEERKPEQLIAPQVIYFHESGTHRMALPYSHPHRMALEKLSEWKVRNLEAVSWAELDWLGMRRAVGIELEYGFRVPLKELSVIWEGVEAGAGQMEAVTRLWAWSGAEGQIWLYFIDQERRQAARGVVEAEPPEWQMLLQSAAGLPKVHFYPASQAANRLPAAKSPSSGAASPAAASSPDSPPSGVVPAESGKEGEPAPASEGAPEGWYLPAAPLEVAEEVVRLEPITLEMINPYLFVDPSYIREMITRDGVSVYTDGSRSLQVEPSRLRLVYDAPMAFSQASQGNERMGYSGMAVQFVNQHGGWTGDYLIDGYQQFRQEQIRLHFRFYHGPYPVYGTGGTGEDGRLLVSMQPEAQVISLERPLYRLGQRLKRQSRILPAGDVVYQRLLQLQREGVPVRQARVAYRMELAKGQVRLVPGWVLAEPSGAFRWLDAAE